ncbi:MAG: DUF2089 family protein [Clostridia bacterium]
MLKYEDLPNWIINLEIEDINFIKNFVKSSGSLKDLSKMYEITYPTMRIRLDKLIEKINLYDSADNDVYIDKIKTLALDGKIDLSTAKVLISEYRKARNK